ncbi:biogenesis of lysosome-related organelles complex 1 subunit 5 isoform X2 [Heliangelus exortis]|uniref:biogenesis of lysosome-related organelles complex 1 subunit 5 isoform X2 n=1 Tax=Heliangelus exortis TaxID=472823 RepID=UPI003A940AB4
MTSQRGSGARRKFSGGGRRAEGRRERGGPASPGSNGAMSGGGPTSPGRSGASPLPSERKREALAAGSPIQPIIKDVGEIYSRLLDHRPVIQGEIRYFVKEFEEKRGLRELRVLENLKNTISETNEHVLPKCEQAMHDNLNETLKRLQAANDMIHGFQERELEKKKMGTPAAVEYWYCGDSTLLNSGKVCLCLTLVFRQTS